MKAKISVSIPLSLFPLGGWLCPNAPNVSPLEFLTIQYLPCPSSWFPSPHPIMTDAWFG